MSPEEKLDHIVKMLDVVAANTLKAVQVAEEAKTEAKAAREEAKAAREEAKAARLLGEANQTSIQLLAEGLSTLNEKMNYALNKLDAVDRKYDQSITELHAKCQSLEERVARLERLVTG
ncbi:hypothetical protein SY88_15165 [Clostridiales bacterium PH28_bin88]|nr:hypothetical protein SY88_15165 [Clostridiales bacterium PH28_bin88]